MTGADPQPIFYSRLAEWWPLVSSPESYATAAAFYREVLESACPTAPATLLELGSGGGHNAFHLKRHFRMTLVDLSSQMLESSRSLNPECEHIQGDMRTFRANRDFDAVMIQDAIMYMTSGDDLRRAVETAYVHCKAGGAALFAPDYVKETFHPGTHHGGHDGDGRALRYLEWLRDPDPSDTTFTVDFAFLLYDEKGVRHEYDRHVLGLFERAEWMSIIREVGFEPRAVPFAHDDLPAGAEVFVGVKE